MATYLLNLLPFAIQNEADTSHPTTSSILLPSIPTTSIPPITQTDTTPIRQFSRRARIAQSSALSTVADKPASPVRDVTPRVTSPAADEGSMQHTIFELTALYTSLQRQHSELLAKFQTQEVEILRLKERVQVLEDREGVAAKQSGDDAPIKGRSINEGEAAAERISNDSEDIARVLTSMDAATVLAGGLMFPLAVVPFPLLVPLLLSFPLAVKFIPLLRSRRATREKEDMRMNEQIARNVEVARIHAEEELQSQQRRPMTKKQKREYYMAMIRNNLGWKVKDFKGLSFEEIESKFAKVWKQVEDFIPMGSKEKAERIKRKGLNLEQEHVKKQKSSEEAPEIKKSTEEKMKEMMQLVPVEDVYVQALQVKHPIIDWKVHTEGQKSYWKIIRLGGSSACYQFFIDPLKQLDREDLNQLWALVKEYLSIRPATSEKNMELWVELKKPDLEDQLWTQTQNFMHAPVEWKLYDLSGVHHVTAKDKKIFMLVEKIILSEKV
nr:hypothetical protein [Tanacetum cinerariifolium]